MSQSEQHGQPPEEDPAADSTNEPPEDGLSLDDLSAAYAQLIDGGAPSRRVEPASSAADADDELADEEEAEATAEDQADVDPRSILEAMLFVGNPNSEPLTSRQIAGLMRGVTTDEVDGLVQELNADYDAQSRPYQVNSVGAGYLLQLRDEFGGLRDLFYGKIREARLSQSAVDVLAMVAYRQPMTRQQVNQLRGKPSGAVLSQLVRRELLRVERPEDQPRNPHYYTTDRFLDLFGLASIEELPQSQEFDRSL